MENESYIKLYKKLEKWQWYKKPNMVFLFIHLLIKANYQDKKWNGIIVKRGQYIASFSSLSEQTGLSIQNIRSCINRLKSTHEITHETTRDYSIITLCKYESYQNNQQANQQASQHATNTLPTTTKEYKEYKEERESNSKKVNDVEKLFESRQTAFESILMATHKNEETGKRELRTYHLWLTENEKYPMSSIQLTAGFEKWLLGAKEQPQNKVMTDKEQLEDYKKNAWKYV